MKDDFQIVLVNFNSVESIIKFILFVFLIVVASIVIHLVRKFISLSIEKKETENKKYKKDQDIQQKEEYYEGYIQGAYDRKIECNNDVIFNRISQSNSSVHGNSSSSWTVTYGPTPVIPIPPINKNLAYLQGDERLAYLQGYLAGHKDDKFWDKQEICSKLKNCEYKQKG